MAIQNNRIVPVLPFSQPCRRLTEVAGNKFQGFSNLQIRQYLFPPFLGRFFFFERGEKLWWTGRSLRCGLSTNCGLYLLSLACCYFSGLLNVTLFLDVRSMNKRVNKITQKTGFNVFLTTELGQAVLTKRWAASRQFICQARNYRI